MFRYLLLLLVLSLPLWSQQGTYNAIQAPDCQFFVYLPSGTATTVVFDNRTTGCTDWAVTYNSSGYSAVSFLFQSAPNNAGSPGTWGAYGGTTVTGSNPMTSTTQTSSTFSGYQPWLRASVTLTGSGIVQGAVYGWRYKPTGSGGGGGGCPDPCPVVGVDAPGAASTADPVQVAGNDGTNVRAIKTDTSGNAAVVGPIADGGSTVGIQPVIIGGQASGNLVRQFGLLDTLTDASATGGRSLAAGLSLFNGTTWDRMRGSTLGAYVQGAIAQAGNVTSVNPLLIGGRSGTAGVALTVSSSGFLQLDGTTVGLGTADGVVNTNVLMPTFQGVANTTTTGHMFRTIGLLYNGSTWDRPRGSATAGLTIGGFGSGASGTLYGMTACNSSAAVSVGPGTTVELVSLTASRAVRVCAFTIDADTAASTAQFVYGTGTNCGTGTTNLTGAYALGVGQSVNVGSGLGELFKTAAGNALCLTAVTGTIAGHVSYAKY